MFRAHVPERGAGPSGAASVGNGAALSPRGQPAHGAPAVAARLDEAFESRLREPLARIAMMAAVLKHELDDSHAEQIDSMVDAAERADSMLNDMLNFIRSETRGIPIVRRRVDLKVLCERVIDAIHNSHPDHPVLFACDSRVEGEFDPDAIALVLSKLLVNAMQHGAPRPPIRVKLRGRANDVVVDVWNPGPPLEADLTERLFEPFVCGSSYRSARAEGLGLGLYLVREVVRAHGGRIEMQSSDQEGTTFRVTLRRR